MSLIRCAAAALVISALLPATLRAQTMRFNTNVGSFDMRLNPTNDANLQPLVDNLVAYIGLGRYGFTAINRAADGNPGTADDFVLQMGSFLAFPPVTDLWPRLNKEIESLDPVVVDSNNDGQVDFSALSNTRGTVSLALQSGNPNSGTNSFFVNLGSNDFLDSQGFVPFARIDDMTTVDKIMQLMQADLSAAAGQNGSLAFTDVPLTDKGRLVVIKSVEVVQADPDFSFVGPVATALQLQQRNAAATAVTAADSAALILDADEMIDAEVADLVVADSPPASVAIATPEPTSGALAAGGLMAALSLRARRRR